MSNEMKISIIISYLVCLISRGFYFESILILVFNFGDLVIKDIFNVEIQKSVINVE